MADYPVENVGPALHGDALEHSEHGEQKIVKVGDAVVGALPAFSANRTVYRAMTTMPCYRTWCGLFFCNGTWEEQR